MSKTYIATETEQRNTISSLENFNSDLDKFSRKLGVASQYIKKYFYPEKDKVDLFYYNEYKNKTYEIIKIISDYNGAISATCDNSNFTLNVMPNAIFIGVKDTEKFTSGTITITQETPEWQMAPNPITIQVTYSNTIPTSLSTTGSKFYTLEEIQTALNNGIADKKFKIGDAVKINFKNKNNPLPINDSYIAIIIGFNHNKELETEGKDSVHFLLGKDILTNTNVIANYAQIICPTWKNMEINTDILPKILYNIDEKQLDYFAKVTKYSNYGNQILYHTSRLFLLSKFELNSKQPLTFIRAGNFACQFNNNKHIKEYDYFLYGNKINDIFWTRDTIVNRYYTTVSGKTYDYSYIRGVYCDDTKDAPLFYPDNPNVSRKLYLGFALVAR